MTKEERRQYYRRWVKTQAGQLWLIKKREIARKWRKANPSPPRAKVSGGKRPHYNGERGRYLSCNSSLPRLGKLATWGYGGYKRNGVAMQYHL